MCSSCDPVMVLCGRCRLVVAVSGSIGEIWDFFFFFSCWIASVVVLLSAVAAIEVMILGGWVF